MLLARLTSLLLLLLLRHFLSAEAATSDLVVMKLEDFEEDRLAFHFSCKESNMFATNCACHLRCTSASCANAVDVCSKYNAISVEGADGSMQKAACKFVLMRGQGDKKIASLKRGPTDSEKVLFDKKRYPLNVRSVEEGVEGGLAASQWAALRQASSHWDEGPSFYELIRGFGKENTAVRSVIKKVIGALLRTKSPELPNYSRLCGSALNSTLLSSRRDFLNQGVSLVVVSYRKPLTLLNSLRSWNASGLLGMVKERIVVLNDPLPCELALAMEYGFKVVQPSDIKGAKMVKKNVLTIGAAYHYALGMVCSPYMLFLEDDFKVDPKLPQEELFLQLLGAAGLLDRGIELVRLQSGKLKGCGTHKDCDHHGIHMDSTSPSERNRNWFAFYCKENKVFDTSGSVADCLDAPAFRCFTSWDSNWSLNAVMVRVKTMISKAYQVEPLKTTKTISDLALMSWDRQDKFEMNMGFSYKWQTWRVPMCIAYTGAFFHEEIETSP